MGLDLWCVGACLCWICGGSRLVVCSGSRLVCRNMSVRPWRILLRNCSIKLCCNAHIIMTNPNSIILHYASIITTKM